MKSIEELFLEKSQLVEESLPIYKPVSEICGSFIKDESIFAKSYR